ncbi:hypothetical protein EBU99_07115 [bacterium]|nr:hypothetical protein [bacterium]
MNCRSQATKNPLFMSLILLGLSFAVSCKPRVFNDAQSAPTSAAESNRHEALAAALMPLWPTPKNASDILALPSATQLGISTSTWQSLLKTALTDSASGRQLTLSNPDCALSVDSWRLSAARLSLYEVDLPGNVTSWQTLALQRESDLAQRVQLHVSVQPWCVSERLARTDFVHSLDHGFLLTFDLSLPFLKGDTRSWLEDLSIQSRGNDSFAVKSENKILPYAKALLDINSSSTGRKALVDEWNRSLQTAEIVKNKSFPNQAWLTAKQALNAGHSLSVTAAQSVAHPTLVARPQALSGFFAKYLSERNLIRVRAHVTEGLGTSQRFLRWEKQSGKLINVPMQTTSAFWDRKANIVTLNPLLVSPQNVARIGLEQPSTGAHRSLLRDVDLETTPLANDISLQELISLNEKILDPERTSVHSTRCVSCHGIDEALKYAREGRPVAQRGINPVALSLFGVSSDGRPVVNLRSLRSAEADAMRFEDELLHAQRRSQ